MSLIVHCFLVHLDDVKRLLAQGEDQRLLVEAANQLGQVPSSHPVMEAAKLLMRGQWAEARQHPNLREAWRVLLKVLGKELPSGPLCGCHSELFDALGRAGAMLFKRGTPFPELEKLFECFASTGYVLGEEVADLSSEVAWTIDELPNNVDPDFVSALATMEEWVLLAKEKERDLLAVVV